MTNFNFQGLEVECEKDVADEVAFAAEYGVALSTFFAITPRPAYPYRIFVSESGMMKYVPKEEPAP